MQIARLASVASSPHRLLAGAGRDCWTDVSVGPERHFHLIVKILPQKQGLELARLASAASSPPRVLASSPELAEIVRLICLRDLNSIWFWNWLNFTIETRSANLKVDKRCKFASSPPRLLASSQEPAEIVRLICPRDENVIFF